MRQMFRRNYHVEILDNYRETLLLMIFMYKEWTSFNIDILI